MVTMLQKKIFRDIGENRWSFLAIMYVSVPLELLCSAASIYM
jgi:hypothetical protein